MSEDTPIVDHSEMTMSEGTSMVDQRETGREEAKEEAKVDPKLIRLAKHAGSWYSSDATELD